MGDEVYPDVELGLLDVSKDGLDELTRVDECGSISVLIKGLQDRHMQEPIPKAELERRFTESYLRRMDPGKILFLGHRHESLRLEVSAMTADMFEGGCDGLHKLRGVQALAHQEMNEYAQGYLADPRLRVDTSLSFQVDHKKRVRPSTKREQLELRDRLLQFQLSNYVSHGLSIVEATKRLRRRYERTANQALLKTKAEDFAQVLRLIGSSLDPHTSYFTKGEFDAFEIDVELSLVGIGARISIRDGEVVVDQLVEFGPAYLDGRLRAKDRIVAVRATPSGDPVELEGLKLTEVVKLIRGRVGTSVELTVERPSQKNGQRFLVNLMAYKDAIY